MSEQDRTGTQSKREETRRTARSSSRPQQNQLNLLALADDIWKGLLRFRLSVLVTVSILSSLFFWYARTQITPVYEATCTFLVNTARSVNTATNYYSVQATNQIARTFPYIIQNDALQNIIEADLGVSEIPGTITATALPDTNMMTVSVRSEDGKAAYDILHSVLRNYGEVAAAVLGETDLTIMNESGVPAWPINLAGGRRFAMYGFLLGLGLWVGFFGLQSYFKKTIRSQDDFSAMLNVNALGSIPKVRRKKRTRMGGKTLLVTDDRIPYSFTEGIRTLRTRIERDHADNGTQVYLVSSALAGEGKSTISANLALSLAGKGLKVVLVDLDIRNSSIMKVLGKEDAAKGMSEYLRGEIPFSKIVVQDEETGLIILPAGHAGQDNVQVINSRKLAKVFSVLRRDADFVIVDTPPSSILSDAAALVRYADAGIFVVRQDFAPIERIKEGIELLSDTGLRLSGCVLNYSEAGLAGYAYGYGYGYGYGKGRYGRYGGYGSSTRRSGRQTKRSSHSKKS